MMAWLYLSFLAGAFAGGCIRFSISVMAGQHRLGACVVTGTLLCNLLGTALLAGLFSGMSFEEMKGGSNMLAAFTPMTALLLGVTGGLSTLSTVAAECMRERATLAARLATLGVHTGGCLLVVVFIYCLRGIAG